MSVAKFTTLEIRTYPDQNPTFEVNDIPKNSASRTDVALSSTSFPFHYDVGQALGTTDQKQWRMTAWLSANGAALTPQPDDPQCSVPFSVDSCGIQFGGYCGDTANVDCTIE